MTRRDLMFALLSGSVMAASVPAAWPQGTAGPQPKPLPFDPTKLNGLSERLLRSHHENNYSGAVRRLAQIEAQLASLPADAPGFQVKGLRMEELIATNSVVLHEEYFGNLGGNGQAAGAVRQTITSQFGSFDQWERQYRAISNSLGGGSGWAVLSFNFRYVSFRRKLTFIRTTSRSDGQYWLMTCSNTPITWTSARQRPVTSMHLCKT
jgi:Fe-Mn family superoxide dismutase